VEKYDCKVDADSDRLDIFQSIGLGDPVNSVDQLLRKAGGATKKQSGWSECKSMPRSRRGGCMVELPDGRLAVLGGGVYPAGRERNHPVLRVASTYNPATGRWLELPQFAHARENFGACCVTDRLRPGAGAVEAAKGSSTAAQGSGESEGGGGEGANTGWWRLIVAGGLQSTMIGAENSLTSVEAFDGEKWEFLPELGQPMEGCSCASLPGRRFALIGGRGLKQAQIFSFRSNSWTALPPCVCLPNHATPTGRT
jgi:hypothetical protein